MYGLVVNYPYTEGSGKPCILNVLDATRMYGKLLLILTSYFNFDFFIFVLNILS